MRWFAAAVPVLFSVAGHAAPRQSNPAFLGIGFSGGPMGCVIDTVTPGGPAADAGIEPGDSILAFDRNKLDPNQPCDQLVAAITAHVPGDRIDVDLVRNMVHREVVAVLGTRADVVQKRVGRRIGSTDLVDVDDPRQHYDLDQRAGKTMVVGFFEARCEGCARVFDKIADRLHDRAKSDVAVLAVTARENGDDFSGYRKRFHSSVPLAVADYDTFEPFSMGDH
ncbi:MAG: PDZ domain-containing protein, partial [Kofleriaceae bacterium]